MSKAQESFHEHSYVERNGHMVCRLCGLVGDKVFLPGKPILTDRNGDFVGYRRIPLHKTSSATDISESHHPKWKRLRKMNKSDWEGFHAGAYSAEIRKYLLPTYPDYIIDGSIKMFLKLRRKLDYILSGNRWESFAVFATEIELRRHGLQYTIEDLCEIFYLDPARYYTCRYKYVVRAQKLGIELCPRRIIPIYLHYANIYNLSPETTRIGKDFLEFIEQHVPAFSGLSKRGLVAAVIYLLKNGKWFQESTNDRQLRAEGRFTQVEICNKMQTNEVTLRCRISDIRELLSKLRNRRDCR